MQRVNILVFIFILARGIVSAQSDTLYIQVGMNPVKTYLVSQIDSITFYVLISDIEAESQPAIIPEQFALLQNYPNPFNPVTTIQFIIPATGKVEVKIYNLNGSLVRELFTGEKEVGEYSYQWDGKDDRGITIASGVYFYSVQFNNSQLTKKMIYLK
jgi:hypothetical protein